MAKRKPRVKEVQVEEIEVVETIEEPKEDYRESLIIVQTLLNSKPNDNVRSQLLRTQTELQDKIKNL